MKSYSQIIWLGECLYFIVIITLLVNRCSKVEQERWLAKKTNYVTVLLTVINVLNDF